MPIKREARTSASVISSPNMVARCLERRAKTLNNTRIGGHTVHTCMEPECKRKWSCQTVFACPTDIVTVHKERLMPQDAIDRDWLYEQVWKVPMAELGKKFGVSRKAVKFACTQLNVPLPPQAYWAHRKAGRSLVRTELPPLQPGQLSAISLKALETPDRQKRLQRVKAKRRALKVRTAIEAQWRFDSMILEVEDWHKANLIRAYLAELDRRRVAGGKVCQDYEEWRAWADEIAASLDLSNVRIEHPK